jgi:hypothetical protein
MKRAWTTDANHIKEIIVELYSSLDDSKSLATLYLYGLYAKMRTWLFSKTARYLQNHDSGERVCFKAGKGYERRRTDYQ